MKLAPGMLIKTNYSGPYRITNILRGCTCASYIDNLNNHNDSVREPHIHLTCTKPDGSGSFHLNRFFEDTLQSLDKSYAGGKSELNYDCIEILENDQPVQLTFF